MTQKTWGLSLALAGCCVAGGPAAHADTILYDLDHNGPETSVVQECVADNSCFGYPINGHIEVTLNNDKPLLSNVDSSILVPPDVNGPISPEVWDYLSLLEGEYLSTGANGDISMRFLPGPNSVMRAYELRVDLTNNRQALSITGGIEQDAASPLEPDVRFFVDGVRLLGSEINDATPEPHAGLLTALAAPWLIASRYRRLSHRQCW